MHPKKVKCLLYQNNNSEGIKISNTKLKEVRMSFVKKHKYAITVILVILVTAIMIIIKRQLHEKEYDVLVDNEIDSITKEEMSKEEAINDSQMCTVDIKGAINNPGTYKVECDKYVHDIIELAAGLTENADTSMTNLAKKITDEMVIIIYTKDEIAHARNDENSTSVVSNECICPVIKNDSCISDESSATRQGIININKATVEELKTLPGIGAAKAKAIVDYRNNFGNFKTIEDIKNVSGIGTKLYEEIKALITT